MDVRVGLQRKGSEWNALCQRLGEGGTRVLSVKGHKVSVVEEK